MKENGIVVASIHLYGNPQKGYGHILAYNVYPGEVDGMVGDDKPVKCRSASEAVRCAVADLRERKIVAGRVYVHHEFSDGQKRKASFELHRPMPRLEDLEWHLMRKLHPSQST